jgi:hypothetical protein
LTSWKWVRHNFVATRLTRKSKDDLRWSVTNTAKTFGTTKARGGPGQ